MPVFQRKCRRPNLWPPEEGDLVDPAYCPFYHLLLLMGLSPYGQGLIKKKSHRRQTRLLTRKLARVIKMDFCKIPNGIFFIFKKTFRHDYNPGC